MDDKFKKKVTDFNSIFNSIIGLIGTISGSCELQVLAFFPVIFEKQILNLIERNDDYYQEIYSELKKVIEETCDETYNKVLISRRYLADFFKEISMKIMYDYETILSLSDISQLLLQKIANEKGWNKINNITKDDVNFLNNLFLNIFQKNIISNQKLCNYLNTSAFLKQNELLNLLQKDINQFKNRLTDIEKSIGEFDTMVKEFNENIKSNVETKIHKKNEKSPETVIIQNETFVPQKFTVINNGYIGTQKTVSIETINGDINL